MSLRLITNSSPNGTLDFRDERKAHVPATRKIVGLAWLRSQQS